MSLDLLYKYGFIKKLVFFFVILNGFLYFFSENIHFEYNTNTFTLFCYFFSFSSVYFLWKNLFRIRKVDGYNKRLITLPVRSDYIFFSLLILLYLNIAMFFVISVLLYMVFFKFVGLFVFFISLLKLDITAVVLITLTFIVEINGLELLTTIITGISIVLFFIYVQDLSIETFVKFANIIEKFSASIVIVIGSIFITFILIIAGVLIYRKRHYREV
jgi:hypothetical protein